jgi:hypothetical protein
MKTFATVGLVAIGATVAAAQPAQGVHIHLRLHPMRKRQL